ncbi:hypothetical protein ID866_4867, partial [Astraeus odoratus]
QGDHVEYRPVGGGEDNVSHTTGTIDSVERTGDQERYLIKNDKTRKSTSYQEKNIVKKID